MAFDDAGETRRDPLGQAHAKKVPSSHSIAPTIRQALWLRASQGPNQPRPGAVSSMDDAAFKKLFSDPRMIELLIRRHVPEWADRIDYRDPTAAAHGTLIDDQLRRRYPRHELARSALRTGRRMWYSCWNSRADRSGSMALRTTIYCCLALQSLIRHDKEVEAQGTATGCGSPCSAPRRQALECGDPSERPLPELRSGRVSGSGPDAQRSAAERPSRTCHKPCWRCPASKRPCRCERCSRFWDRWSKPAKRKTSTGSWPGR